MKVDVPYHGNPGNACALACYTMVAQHLLPNEGITYEALAEVAGWKPGYVVWPAPVWAWLLERGVSIIDYDVIDYEAWATEGLDGLRRSVPPEEYSYYEQHTYDLAGEGERMRAVLDNERLTYVRRKLTWDDVTREHELPGIVDVVVNSSVLNGEQGVALHRVVLLGITSTEVTFHDPNADWSGASRTEPLSLFRDAFEALDGPELARYSSPSDGTNGSMRSST